MAADLRMTADEEQAWQLMMASLEDSIRRQQAVYFAAREVAGQQEAGEVHIDQFTMLTLFNDGGSDEGTDQAQPDNPG